MADQNEFPEPKEKAFLEPTQTTEPAQTVSLTGDELQEFERFRRFQEFMRTNTKTGETPSSEQPPYSVSPSTPPQAETTADSFPKVAAPRWLKKLGAKIISMFLLLIVLIIAGKLAYNYFFPRSGNSTAEFVKQGGGKYHTNDLLSHDPYGAVRAVYKLIGEGSGDNACYLFDDAARQKFAANLGFADCSQAVIGLHAQVTDFISYTDSVPFYRSYEPPDPVITVNSCSFAIKGGPSLGAFTLTRVEMGQWLITDHTLDPTPCPPLPQDPDLPPLTWPSHPTTSISFPTTSLSVPTTSLNIPTTSYQHTPSR